MTVYIHPPTESRSSPVSFSFELPNRYVSEKKLKEKDEQKPLEEAV